MKQGGRPVVYVDNSKTDPFRMAILGLMRAAKAASEKDANLKKQIEYKTRIKSAADRGSKVSHL
jgi:hypothetical protein